MSKPVHKLLVERVLAGVQFRGFFELGRQLRVAPLAIQYPRLGLLQG